MKQQHQAIKWNNSHLNNSHLNQSLDPRREAVVKLNSKLPNLSGIHTLIQKVDTGAQANTISTRTYKLMFPNEVNSDGSIKTTNIRATNIWYRNKMLRC